MPHARYPLSPGRCGLILIAAAVLAGCGKPAGDAPAVAQPATSPTALPASSAEPTASQVEAAAILKAMSEHLGAMGQFSVTARLGYEVLQPSGQKIEFGETRRITLARPDRLRVDEVASDGERNLVLFDGKQLTVFSADADVYAQAPQPAAIDDALIYFVRDLRMRMPLAQLLSTHVGTDLPAMARQIDYVEETEILGKAAHHIAGRTDDVDFQFWIATGDQPLLLRAVLTYREESGQPRFWTDFTDWNLKPKVTDQVFSLDIPRGAQRIPFAVQVPSLAQGGPQ